MRRRKSDQHEFAPDARYGSDLVTHLVNIIMSRGKKSTAQRTVYGALDQIMSRPAKSRSRCSSRRWRTSSLSRSQQPPRRRRDLPGAHRGFPPARRAWRCGGSWITAGVAKAPACSALAPGNPRCLQESGQRGQEARRHPQDGRRQQGRPTTVGKKTAILADAPKLLVSGLFHAQ